MHKPSDSLKLDSTNMTPRNCGLLVRWAIHRYGSISAALDMAEVVAIYLLASDEVAINLGETVADHMPFYQDYIHKAKSARHAGDCSIAAAWLIAPITCRACLYEDYVVRALQWLRAESKLID